MKNHISYLVIFHPIFLNAVAIFSTFISLYRSQIDLKVKTENFLMCTYGYNAGPPMAIPIYTVLYTVLCDKSG